MSLANTLDNVLARIVKCSDGCWLWTGALVDGYGSVRVQGRQWLVHRYAYEQLVGPIPDGLVLDHLCRNRACANPGHLRVVTQRENVLAPGSLSLTKRSAEATCCVHGHPFDVANTHIRPSGRRDCRTCKQEWNRQRRFRRHKS